ncbi:pksA [Symbiodinium microadriaticum]|nr:pksA [Symbiodinium microadriaticum]
MPKQVDHNQKRLEIADGAIAAIAERGLDQVRLTDIARACGATTGTIIHYFQDKESVLHFTMATLIDEVTSLLIEFSDDYDPVVGAAFVMPLNPQRLMEWQVWLQFVGRGPNDTRYGDLHESYADALASHLSKVLRANGAKGDTDLLADLIIAAVDGISIRATLQPGKWPPERQVENLSALLGPVLREAGLPKMKVLILGAAGGMGSVTARTVAQMEAGHQVIISDLDGDAANKLASELGPNATGLQLDVLDRPAMAKAMEGVDLVLSCAGPFYKIGLPVLEQVIDAGCHYADICDDWEPTLEFVELSEKAKAKGVCCLIGLGASPGISNMLAVSAADALDDVEEIITAWSIEGDATELDGALESYDPKGKPSAALVHWMLQLSGKIRIWKDGRYQNGKPLKKRTLPIPGGGSLDTWTVGHPEAVTLPRVYKDMKASTNVMLGNAEDFKALKALSRLINFKLLTLEGAAKKIEQSFFEAAQKVSPDDRVSMTSADRKTPPLMGWAKGMKDGKAAIAMAQSKALPAGGMGGITGIPLALAVPLKDAGAFNTPGVFTIEEIVKPGLFFELLAPYCSERLPSQSDDGSVIRLDQTTALALAAFVGTSSSGFAQGAEPEAQETRTPTERAALEEIVVTAQKRAENIQDVPLSVTAISGQDIKDKNMGELNTLATYAPNMDILATPTFNFIYMRGIGSEYNKGFEQSVGIIIDEVFYGRASYVSNGLLDLSGVEVLRGPQGTLYGKNSAAGALHLKTADPGDDWEFDLDGLYGPDNHYRFRGAFGGPLPNDLFGFRVALLAEEADGGIENTTLGGHLEQNVDNQTARLKVKFQPSASFSMLLTGTGATVNEDGSGTELTRVRPRHLAAMQVFDPLTSDDQFDGKSQQDGRGYVDRDVWDATLRAEWEMTSWLTLTSVSNIAWFDEDVQFDADFSPIPFLVFENDETYNQVSQEIRLTSGAADVGGIEFVAGLFFYANEVEAYAQVDSFLTLAEVLLVTGEGERSAYFEIDEDPQGRKDFQEETLNDSDAGALAGNQIALRQAAAGTPLIERSYNFFDQSSTSYAIFGQAKWLITEQLSVTGGLRANWEEKTVFMDHALINFDPTYTGLGGGPGLRGNGNPVDGNGDEQENFTPGGAIGFPIFTTGDTDFIDSRTREEFQISPKLSFQMDWTEEVMSYLTIAQGYKSGGFNASPTNISELEYEEEVSWSGELGLRSEGLDGALRWNMTFFWSEFEDIQIATFNGTRDVVGNAASARVKGVEFEGMFVPVMGLFLTGNGAFTHAYYQDFENGPCTYEAVVGPPCDLTGRPLANVPEVQLQIGATWDDQLFNWPMRLHAGFDASYQSEMFTTRDLDPIDIREGGYYMDARLGLRGLDEAWHLMVFVSNVLDEQVAAGSDDVPTFRGSHFGGPFPGRRIEVEARVSF